MEHLFQTNIPVNNRSTVYNVDFDHEQYVFTAGQGQGEFSKFALRREHDEWHELQPLPAELKQQAVDALENFLLKQH